VIGYMVIQNVRHRPLRTLITVLGVSVEVMLVILIVGLTSGLLQDYGKRTAGVGADVMVQPPSSSMFINFGGAPMPTSIAAKLLELAHVQAVAPVLVQLNSYSALENIFGIDPVTFRAVSGGFVFHAGHDLTGPDDILVDDIYAAGKKVKVGQTLRLLSHDFQVVGIVEHGKSARLFVQISTLQSMMGAEGKASLFLVKCDVPSSATAVQTEVRQLLPGYQIRLPKDFLALLTSSNVPFLGTFINVMIGIAVVVGLLVTFLAMYTTIVERTREIGVLKALGASKAYIVRIILSEATLLCLGGVAAGVILSFVTKEILHKVYPSLPMLLTGAWVGRAGAIAIAGGLLGAAYPAWLASRRDPVEALAYD
jgi:putative ABC transport system permease protein